MPSLEENFDEFKSDVIDRLARLETKQDAALSELRRIHGRLSRAEDALAAHEAEFNRMAGAAAARGAVGGFLSAFLFALVGWLLRKIG